MIAAFDVTGGLNLAGLAGIITAMGGFLLKVQKDERRERESMRQEFRKEREERDDRLAETLAEDRRATELFLGNHLSHIPKAMERVAERLEALERATDRAHPPRRKPGGHREPTS